MEGREGRWRRMGTTQVLTHTLSLLVPFQSKNKTTEKVWRFDLIYFVARTVN